MDRKCDKCGAKGSLFRWGPYGLEPTSLCGRCMDRLVSPRVVGPESWIVILVAAFIWGAIFCEWWEWF